MNAAHALLERQVALAESMRLLSSRFELSKRQAYRYLEAASQLDRPVEAAEPSVPITLKLPRHTVALLRRYARGRGMTMGSIVTDALKAFLEARKRHG